MKLLLVAVGKFNMNVIYTEPMINQSAAPCNSSRRDAEALEEKFRTRVISELESSTCG